MFVVCAIFEMFKIDLSFIWDRDYNGPMKSKLIRPTTCSVELQYQI